MKEIDQIETVIDALGVPQRFEQPPLQLSRTDGGLALIQHFEQGVSPGAVVEKTKMTNTGSGLNMGMNMAIAQ